MWCDESSLYSRINYVHSPDGELLCGSDRSLKRCTQGLARTRIAYANAPVLTRKNGVCLAWKDLCSVLNALNA